MPPDYSKGKIYTIRCRTNPEHIYVGSTIQPLSKRWGGHKTSSVYKKRSHLLIYVTIRGDELGWDNWFIELYEDFPCERREEMLKREGEIIRKIGSLNMKIAGRTDEEYVNDNKELLSQKGAKYRKENKEQIQACAKKRYYSDDRQAKIQVYREENKKQLSQTSKIYRETHSEEIKLKKNRYYINNQEKIRAKGKIYHENNREILNKKNTIYYHKNKEEINKQIRDFREKNKDKIEKIKCECGYLLSSTTNLEKHKLSPNHIQLMNKNYVENDILKMKCDCGLSSTIKHIARHKKTPLHIELMKNK
ncbi:hypothetical protein T484DRAFT_1758676 [Baffinella frigidus]|nr:hypothetical protein T484DRAFT_1758676 [Cryptophyta sp. CCMP2293]